MPEVPVFSYEAVLEAVSPLEAIERVRDGFVEYAGGEWAMPPKVYLDAAPNGDFRAMPARGAGLAILKWVTSFPGNPAAGLPVVMGVICVSSLADGRPLALIDVRAVTALRTGAIAAVAAQELAREDARTAGIIGCGLHGAWAARCLAAAEAEPAAVAACALFCDEWEQASHGGELTAAVEAGLVSREQATELGDVLSGASAGRADPQATTLFDSTGLAIQDLALCLAVLEAHRAGTVGATTVVL